MEDSSCHRCGRAHSRYPDFEREVLARDHLLRHPHLNEEERQRIRCYAYAIENISSMPSVGPGHSYTAPFRSMVPLQTEMRPRPNSAENERQHQNIVPPASASQIHMEMALHSLSRCNSITNMPFTAAWPARMHSSGASTAIPDYCRSATEEVIRRQSISAAPGAEENMRTVRRPNETAQHREARFDGALRALARTNNEQKRPRSPDLEDHTNRREEVTIMMNERLRRMELSNSYQQEMNTALGHTAMIPESGSERRQRKERQFEAIFDELRNLQGLHIFHKREYHARLKKHMECINHGESERPQQQQSLERQRLRLESASLKLQQMRRRLQDQDLLPAPSIRQQENEKAQKEEKDRKKYEAAEREFVMLAGLAALDAKRRDRREREHLIAVARLEQHEQVAIRERRKRRARRHDEFREFQEDQWMQTAQLKLKEEAFRLNMAAHGASLWPKFPKWKLEWSTTIRVTHLSYDAEPHRLRRFQRERMWFVG